LAQLQFPAFPETWLDERYSLSPVSSLPSSSETGRRAGRAVAQSRPAARSRLPRSRTKYRRFATAAEALRYAVEDLRTPKAFGAWLEVGDERFNSIEIQRLYEASDYPLRNTE
jgi:hypothetical protein